MFTRKRFPLKVVYYRIYDYVYGPGELRNGDVRWFEDEAEFEDWLRRSEELGRIGEYTYHYQIASKEWEVAV